MDAKCSIPGCTDALGGASGWAYLSLVSHAGNREGAVCSRHAYCLATVLNGRDVAVPTCWVAGQGASVRRPKILVVDDDRAISEALAELLQDEGYQVARAADGEEALATLRGDTTIGLIILDLMMPGMDGSTFRGVQQEDPRLAQIPVIVISAMNRAADAVAALRPAAVLSKPINVTTLLDRVGLLC
jgi:CheY-like chemotaxis protein